MMDLYASEAIETSTKPNNLVYDILKKALQLLIPLSLIMSILLSSSYHNNFHFSFFSHFHALERKYIMFLICNGILAFLSNTLSFTSSFTLTTDLYYTNCLQPFNIQSSPDTLHLDHDVPSKNDDSQLQDEEEEEEEEEMFSGHGGDLKVAALETEKGEEEEEEEEEEENDMNINTEELNRRVEEFIRKMKEEIRIEAKQQLIAV